MAKPTITRDDLNESIKNLSTLVDVKMDRLLDKVEGVHSAILAHIVDEAERDAMVLRSHQAEVSEIRKVHEVLRVDVEGLKKYRWTLVGAIAAITVLIEVLSRALYGFPRP